jgi:hypothetical protein
MLVSFVIVIEGYFFMIYVFLADTNTLDELEPASSYQARVANDNHPTPVLRLVHAPAGLSRCEAAAYVGVSPVAFDALVASGLMPPPLPLGIRRRVWNVRALDRALDILAGIERSLQPEVVTAAGREARNTLLEMLGDDQD